MSRIPKGLELTCHELKGWYPVISISGRTVKFKWAGGVGVRNINQCTFRTAPAKTGETK